MIKTKMLIITGMLLCGTMHAMHDARTEADRAAIEKAKAQLEKTQSDEEGMLGVLGNTNGISLINKAAEDREKYEAHKKKKEDAAKMPERKAALIAWQQECSKSERDVGFKKFFDLPYDLQAKILREYCHDERALYALRHKRELAPLMIEHVIWHPRDALSVLDELDKIIRGTKGTVSKRRAEARRNNKSIASLEIMLALKIVLPGHSFCEPDFRVWLSPPADPKGGWFNKVRDKDSIVIFGYSDCTYDILFNREQFKQLIEQHSLEQLQLFVDLAKIPRPQKNMALLSKQQCAVFQSLSFDMQQTLKKLYPWIYFESAVRAFVNHWIYFESKVRAFVNHYESSDVRGIDEHIECVQNAALLPFMKWVAQALIVAGIEFSDQTLGSVNQFLFGSRKLGLMGL